MHIEYEAIPDMSTTYQSSVANTGPMNSYFPICWNLWRITVNVGYEAIGSAAVRPLD